MRDKGAYLWSMIGRFGPQFIYMVTTMVLARFLTPDDFGTLGVLTVFIAVANVLLDSGLGGSLIKEKIISETDKSTIFVFNLVMSFTLYLGLCIAAPLLEKIYEIEGLRNVVYCIGIVFVVNSVGLVPKTILMKEMKFKRQAFIAFIGMASASLIAITLACLNAGVYALVAFQITNAFVSSVLYLHGSNFKISFIFSIDSLKRLLPFGIYTTLANVVDTIYENIITISVGKFASVKDAGYLFQSKNLEEAGSRTLVTAFQAVAFPALTKLKEDQSQFIEESRTVFQIIPLMVTPVLVCLGVFSTSVITILFGVNWLPSAGYLSMFMIAAFFFLLENINRTFIKAYNRPKTLLLYTFYKRFVGVSILLAAICVSVRYIVLAYVVSCAVGYLFNCVAVERIISYKYSAQFTDFLTVSVPNLLLLVSLLLVKEYIHNIVLIIMLIIVLYAAYYAIISKRYGITIHKKHV